MHKRTLCLILPFSLLATAPAWAGEARIEARTGYVETNLRVGRVGSLDTGTGANIGAALGYDFDLGKNLFIGPEASVDFTTAQRNVLGARVSNARQFTLAARFGVKIGNDVKLYLLGGIANSRGRLDQVTHTENGGVGAIGLEYSISKRVFVKAESRYIATRFDVGGLNNLGRTTFKDRRFLTGVGFRF
ncbi:MAG: outer membrane protein [Sphingomonadaceae bacterium]